MKVFQNYLNHFKFSNYNLLSFSCWFRGKSELPLLNEIVKVVNVCVKHYLDLKNSVFRVVGLRRFSYPIISNYWNNIVLGGVIMKPPN